MKKIFFLLNNINEFTFQEYIDKYLSNCSISIGGDLPSTTNDFDLVILWNYRKIIKNVPTSKNNIILFHSSDLPEGKGWAPIYNAIKNKKKYYTISGILLAEGVDSGNILVKCRFEILNNYTADNLRLWDQEISVLLIKEILERSKNRQLDGKKQVGEETFYSRRKPSDNEISITDIFENIIPHLRACEKQHPAYFIYSGVRYNIYIEAADRPNFPKNIDIKFYDDL